MNILQKPPTKSDRVSTLMGLLDVSVEKTAFSDALSKIPILTLIMLIQYLRENKVIKDKLQYILPDVTDKLSHQESSLENDLLRWALIPIATYIQQTLGRQPLVEYREGSKKCYRLFLLQIIAIELNYDNTLTLAQKITLTRAFLTQATRRDRMWDNGKDAIAAIKASLSCLTYLSSNLDNEPNKLLLNMMYNLEIEISKYQSKVDHQQDPMYLLTEYPSRLFGVDPASRQGTINAKIFRAFFDEANQIAQAADLSISERFLQIQEALAKIHTKPIGPESGALWDRLNQILQSVKQVFVHDNLLTLSMD